MNWKRIFAAITLSIATVVLLGNMSKHHDNNTIVHQEQPAFAVVEPTTTIAPVPSTTTTTTTAPVVTTTTKAPTVTQAPVIATTTTTALVETSSMSVYSDSICDSGDPSNPACHGTTAQDAKGYRNTSNGSCVQTDSYGGERMGLVRDTSCDKPIQ